MKNSKRIIIALIILVIIIIITILGLLIVSRKNNALIPDEVEYGLKTELYEEVERVQDRNRYYIVKKIVENYYYDLAQFNMTENDVLSYDLEEARVETESQIKAYKNLVYNYLDDEYIETNDITIDNIQEKLGNYKEVVTLIEDIYVLDIKDTLQAYFVVRKCN